MILNGIVVLGVSVLEQFYCCTFAGPVCVYVLEKHIFCLFFSVGFVFF